MELGNNSSPINKAPLAPIYYMQVYARLLRF